MESKKKGALFGAFAADSLALGVHWVYNTTAIDKKVGTVDSLMAPIVSTFHPNRKKGEQTQYGDHMLFFLRFLSENTGEPDSAGGTDSESFYKKWSSFFETYDGYKDHAMQDTLKNIKADKRPAGADSTDLGAVFYLPPLAVVMEDSEALIDTLRQAVAMTHNNKQTIEAITFLGNALLKVLDGASPSQGLHAAFESTAWEFGIPELVQKGFDSAGKDTRETIKEFGQACSVEHGLPGVVHLVETYGEDFKTAMIANVMAGGDSASRGIAAGALIGAAGGMEGIPEEWKNGLAAGEELRKLTLY